MITVTFSSTTSWSGGASGEGRVASGGLTADISIPDSLGGAGTGTNPEEMLLGTAASCFTMTLANMLDKEKVPASRIEVESVGAVDHGNELTYQSIVHRPSIVLNAQASDQDRQKAEQVARKAGESCLVSRTIAGNVDVSVEPTVTTE